MVSVWNRSPTIKAIFFALVLITTLMSWIAIHAEAAQQSPEKSPGLLAEINFNIDGKSISEKGILMSQVNDAIQNFFNEHKAFTLSEVSKVFVVAQNGDKVKLSEISKIEVDFRKNNEPK